MKHRNIISFLLLHLILISLCLVSCSLNSHEAASTLPNGVYEFGDSCYYLIELPPNQTVESYFTLFGKHGTVVVDETDMNTYSEHLGTVYYSQVAEGGWVAYFKSKTGTILYMPESIPADSITRISSRLAWNSDNYMYFEEAKQYLPFLNSQ